MTDTALRGFLPMEAPAPVAPAANDATGPERPPPDRPPAGPAQGAATAPVTNEASDVFESSPWLSRVMAGEDPLASARRAGLGLAMTIPFALACGLRTESPLASAVVAGLGLPVGLALIALVGVAASTLGISLASAPLAPAAAASIASRGLFRAGLLLAGLSPVTALWVAGGRLVESALASTCVLLLAGATGIGSIALGLVRATATPRGEWRLGALGVALLFAGFALVVGLRLWLHAAPALLASGEGF